MATSVDMSLDDIIQQNRGRGRGRGKVRRGRGFGGNFGRGRTGVGRGAARRGPLSVSARPSQFGIAKPARRMKTMPWQHGLLEDSIRAAGITGVEVGTKLYISNLDHGVSNDDIRDLFAEIGDLKRYAVHYDKSGRSTGSAEVVYTRRGDAFVALKKYNNVLLDGKPMGIEIVGTSAGMQPISARISVTGVNGRRKRTVFVNQGFGNDRGQTTPVVSRGSFQRNSRGGLRNARGRGRGRGGGGGAWSGGRGNKRPPVEKSADQLDKDLENYHAMQT